MNMAYKMQRCRQCLLAIGFLLCQQLAQGHPSLTLPATITVNAGGPTQASTLDGLGSSTQQLIASDPSGQTMQLSSTSGAGDLNVGSLPSLSGLSSGTFTVSAGNGAANTPSNLLNTVQSTTTTSPGLDNTIQQMLPSGQLASSFGQGQSDGGVVSGDNGQRVFSFGSGLTNDPSQAGLSFGGRRIALDGLRNGASQAGLSFGSSGSLDGLNNGGLYFAGNGASLDGFGNGASRAGLSFGSSGSLDGGLSFAGNGVSLDGFGNGASRAGLSFGSGGSLDGLNNGGLSFGNGINGAVPQGVLPLGTSGTIYRNDAQAPWLIDASTFGDGSTIGNNFPTSQLSGFADQGSPIMTAGAGPIRTRWQNRLQQQTINPVFLQDYQVQSRPSGAFYYGGSADGQIPNGLAQRRSSLGYTVRNGDGLQLQYARNNGALYGNPTAAGQTFYSGAQGVPTSQMQFGF